MKLISVKPLVESVTFSAVEKPEGKDYYTSRYTKVTKKCWVCDGTGKPAPYDDPNLPCDYCGGKGVYEDEENEGPELNVSNANASVISKMLDYDDSEDGMGMILNKDIPMYIHRLMKIKNSHSEANMYTRQDFVERGQMTANRSGEIPSIGRAGPTIHHMGLDSHAVMRYVDKLLEIFKYAKENGMNVSWA